MGENYSEMHNDTTHDLLIIESFKYRSLTFIRPRYLVRDLSEKIKGLLCPVFIHRCFVTDSLEEVIGRLEPRQFSLDMEWLSMTAEGLEVAKCNGWSGVSI